MQESSQRISLRQVLNAFVFITGAPLCLQLHASEQSGLTLHPHAGVLTSGNIKDFGQDTGFGLGIGYQFNEKWAIEFVKQHASSTLKESGKSNIDIENWHIDALYHLNGNDVLTPYASAGYGAIDYAVEGAANDDGNVYNVGMGLKHALSKFTDLRAELRTFRSTDSVYAGTITTLGFQHRFGGKTKSPTPIERRDDDRDGVLNSADRCPSTPYNSQVDASGCALDTDQDGVPDHADDCPTTTNRRAKIDSDGCYIMVNESTTISEVFYFATDSYASPEVYKSKLKKLVDFLQENSASEVVVSGYADQRGSSDYHLALSENRTNTIAQDLLRETTLDASGVVLRSYGETQAATQDDDEEDHAANRRVTVEISAQRKTIALK